ncbi:maleylpyruvate isomerase family mycothiol-dependent enzyme [Nocardioides sp.]|uniref:maleylpyruvate isomerase family mycothiol-dependent enzyme n=1 Tax=Nocardioides sp. TaxID=35761 RepID=UPI00271E5A1D|nr:maleylpyruvate isomerase family mycothiol-dependent enzyme [Nocardioides sp.]MDO9457950.1 maleylpyruvate isomerase family mycothiol-dependent enzyme [Nocardioides sp.]
MSTQLHDATRRLVRTVDGLDDAAYAEPSLLPGWSRAHLVAHLALNAEALAAALHGVVAGQPVPMYAGTEARDADIEALSRARPTVLRSRLYGAVTDLTEALAALPDDRLDVLVERTPGSDRTFVAGDVAAMRLREVEIHHVDLATGYTASDWPEAFAVLVVGQLGPRAGGATLVATDVGRTWQGGPGTPTVSGTAAHLGWWLSGRGRGEGLTSDGVMPGIEAW